MHSSKDYIRIVTLIYLAMLLVQIFLLVISIWEIAPRREKQHDIHYMSAVGVIFIAGLYLSYTLSIKHIEKGKRRRGIREKLVAYKKGLYCRWAIIEFMYFSAIAAYIMTAEKLFILASLFAMIIFLYTKPSINRTIEDLDLDESESRILQTSDAAL